MKNREAFAKAAAAALIVSGVLANPVFAQDVGNAPTSKTSTTQQTPQKGELTKSWSVTTDPLLPLGAIGGLGAAYAILSLYAARRRTQGAWMRLGAGGVIALALLNPEMQQESREALPTEIVIVVDKSASQTLGERTAETEQVRAELTAALAAMGGVNVRTIEVGGTKGGVVQDGTNAFATLQDGLAEIPRDRIGAVLMLTDGQVHDVPEKLAPVAKDVPLHVLLSGREGEKDRRIVIDQAPHFALVKQPQSIKFRVLDDGVASSTDKVRVRISSEGRTLGTQYVTPGQVAEVKLDIPHAGPNIIELQTDTLSGELTDVNNRIVTQVEGIRESLNVFVISGAPNAGLRMWRQMFKSDADANLVHFTALSTPNKVDETPIEEFALVSMPMDELFVKKLDKFDVIVFDHFGNDGMLPEPYIENIAAYVRNGGSLLVIDGPDYATVDSLYNSPLRDLLPAKPTGNVTEQIYKPKLTEDGQRHPVTRGLNGADIKDPQWGSWFRIVDTENATGNVLLSGPDKKPLLILDHKDKGRVAMLTSDNAWLWANGYDGGGPHADLLQRISHWMMKNPTLEEEALRMRRQDGNIIVEQQTMSDKATSLKLHTPSGKDMTLTLTSAGPGQWQATIPATEFGLYSVEQGGKFPLQSFINIGPINPKEFSYTVSTSDLLKPVADATGGKIVRMTDGAGKVSTPKLMARHAGEKMVDDNWLGLRMTDVSILKDVNRTPLFPGWLGALLALGMMAGAFYKEGETKFFGKKAAPRDDGPSVTP